MLEELINSDELNALEERSNFTERHAIAVEFDALFSGARYDGEPVYQTLFGDQFDIIEGKADSAFLGDVPGLHHGLPPKRKAHLLVWIRYGMYRNQAYQNNKLAPVDYDWSSGHVAGDPRHRYINRLVLGTD
ncbi:MAG: hypothetical protein QF605_03115 [Rhodospirillales bacterium]|nr:hypothetical protein [Rhodospirillales bacterium]